MVIIIFTIYECRMFVSAVYACGLRSDAIYGAIDMLIDNDQGEIVDKYNSLSHNDQKRFRQAARAAVRDYRAGAMGRIEDYFEGFIA